MNDPKLFLVQKAHQILSRWGRGGSLPGELALKMDPDFIGRFHMPETVILVTGTNGKTTTSNLIAESLRAAGKTVLNNHRGDNLNVGIATLLAAGSDENYYVKADAAVIEVDELTLFRQFANLHPTHLVVTNFFRDQLDRAGEMETIIRKIIAVLENFHGDLILNGDDPNVVRLADHAPYAKVHFYSVDRYLESRTITDEAGEGKFCPRCGSRLIYDYYQYSHIGRFYCPNDHFGEIVPEILGRNVDFMHGTFEVNGKTYHSFVNTIYGIYNCCAVLCLLSCLNIDGGCAAEVFSTYHLKEGRNEQFHLSRPCVINLIKNPTGANEVMKYIIAQPMKKNICIFLNDNDQDGHDVSWIWDAHFERLKDPLVQKIVCSGQRAYDMALRLKYEGLEDRILVIEDSSKAIEWMDDQRMESFIMATYTALHPTRRILARQERGHRQ